MFKRIVSPLSRGILPIMGALCLAACGEEPAAPPAAAPTSGGPSVPAGNAVVRMLPEKPTSSDCLQMIVTGQPASPQVSWVVNGQPVQSPEKGKLCPESYRRGDQVIVKVGGASGASVSVTIANSPPRVTGIKATPDQIFAGSDIEVAPVGEDKDGDSIDFRYQWVVNGEADPFLTTNRLPGNRFVKGNVIQVRITPYDGTDEGPVYESYRMTIPGAPPQIVSNPPQQFEALEYRYQVTATDADGDALTWRLDKAPTGMTINPATGLITWPMTGVAPGAYPMRIVVRDPDGGEAFQEFTLTLGAPK